MSGITTVFFGTPDWAVPSLEALLASEIAVTAVVTNPDRPAGRGMKLTTPPVKVAALAAGIPVEQPASAKSEGFAATLAALAPDVAVVVAYGKILPAPLLAVPSHGFVNLHFSLLPLYRGAAPVQRAIIEGRTTTGASTMLLTEGMDEGPTLAAIEVEIGPDESALQLGHRLAIDGAPLLVDSVSRYVAGELEPRPQDDSLATYAPKVTEEEARISWDRPFAELSCLVRGLDPAPGAWTTLDGKRLRIFRLEQREGPRLAAGELQGNRELLVGCGDGTAAVAHAQLQGKRRISGPELARGLRLSPGDRVE